jgi:DNA-binding response OmpR family regulator
VATILVYDADARFRENLKAALISLGHEAVVSPDGYSVLPLAEAHRPGLFILDFKLPEADGFEILKRIRAASAFAATPVLFASVTPWLEIEMTVMNARAVGYVEKPLDLRRLKDAIDAFVAPAGAAPALAPPPGEPLPPSVFSGEADLDGSRDGVIDLD